MGADVMGAYEDDSSAGGTDYLLVAYGGFWHELRWTPLPWLDLGARVSRRCGLYYLKTSGGVDVSTIVGLEPGLVAGLLFGGFRVQLQASWLIAIGGGPVGGPTVSWSQPTGPSLALSLGLAM